MVSFDLSMGTHLRLLFRSGAFIDVIYKRCMGSQAISKSNEFEGGTDPLASSFILSPRDPPSATIERQLPSNTMSKKLSSIKVRREIAHSQHAYLRRHLQRREDLPGQGMFTTSPLRITQLNGACTLTLLYAVVHPPHCVPRPCSLEMKVR